MTEGLSRKKKVRGGHRSSTTRIISQIYETMESTDEVEVVVTKLRQCKLALQEKLEIIKQLDDEILQLVEAYCKTRNSGCAFCWSRKIYCNNNVF